MNENTAAKLEMEAYKKAGIYEFGYERGFIEGYEKALQDEIKKNKKRI